MLLKRSEAIKNFLMASTHADLAALYTSAMECQVNVAQDNGTRVDGEYKGRQWVGWSDGLTTWKSFRIPNSANTEPIDNDYEIRWDLAQHAEGIGMTGWDWQNRLSRWVGFDFDAIVGHSEKHAAKLANDALLQVEQAAREIDWVTVRRSTSGKGYHLYVFLDPIPTANHTEHSALARSILGMMSAEVGFDFQAKVDAQGGNMWIWHRKMRNTNGLELIKPGNILYEVPKHWRDHIQVITGKRKKILPTNLEHATSTEESLFEETCGQVTKVNLNEEHKRLILWLNEHGFQSYWNTDYHMLITHTYGLAKAHEALQLKGVYKTLSEGRDQGDQNCFMFPLPDGAWVVRRYSTGVLEAETWDQDRNGYTRCFFNRVPDLITASKSLNAPESKSGGYIFPDAATAKDALALMGHVLDVPDNAWSKQTKLKEHKSGRVLVEIEYDAVHHSHRDFREKGFAKEGKWWTKILNVQAQPIRTSELTNYDNLIRHVVTESGSDAGWVIRSDDQWRCEPMGHITAALKSLGVYGRDLDVMVGDSVRKPWTIVIRPFQPEYPGDRQWNREAAQFRYPPSTDLDNLSYPHWDMIFEHIGSGLDSAIATNDWCKQNGIKKGIDYLRCWVASVFQYPLEPLPYLFLFSEEQSTGKSIFHEALALLLTAGLMRADTSLVNPQAFNAELENAIICVVEETNLRINRDAKNRIKDWVTSRTLLIHRKNQTPYPIENPTHWIQCSNEEDACPVPSGDTRIVAIRVPPLERSIPKRHLLLLLQKEASDFLASILSMEIPESNDRLNLPVIETDQKARLTDLDKNEVERFIDEKVFSVPGEMVSIKDLWDAFCEYLDPMELASWTKQKMVKKIPGKYPKGRCRQNAQWHFGNMSLDPKARSNGKRCQLVGEFLNIEEIKHAN